MKSKKNSEKQSIFSSYWLILIAPLLTYPLMVNLRVFPFVAPNEEPKWALLIICALWMGVSAAWLWFKSKASLQVTKPNWVGILLASYVAILAIGIFIGPNTTEGAIRFAFWFFYILILLLSIWAIRNVPKWLNALTWSISIGSFIFSLRYWISYFQDYDKPNYNIHVLFSPIGHVNFTGDVLIILLPMLIWALVTKANPILRVLTWFSVTTLLTVLLVASSRGALGGVAVGSILTLIITLKHYPNWKLSAQKKELYIPALLVLSTVITSYMTYDALPFHYRDLARVSASAGQTVSGEGKIKLTPNVEQPPLVDMWVKLSPLLGARTSIFASTTAMTLDAPILGQGTGNFPWVYPSFSNRYPDFRDPLSSARTFTTNPHNVVLQIASQNGLIAMMIFMGLLSYFWFRLAFALWHTWNGFHAAGVAAISAVIFDAMFNHVFYNPASMFVFALLAGSWWGSLAHKKDTVISIQPKVASFMTLTVIIVLCIWPIRWVVSEWHVGQAMAHAQNPKLEAYHYQTAYVWDRENFRASFGMGQVAYKQKDYAKSALYFKEFENFYPYNPPALNMLGAAYMMSGQYEKAEAALQRALKIYPGFDMVEQNLQRVQSILKYRSQNKLP